MNYIKHLNKVFKEFQILEDIRPYHISLYLAFFMSWNEKLFPEEFSFYRGEMMKRAKIKTPSQYHKAIKDLQLWNFIEYTPSKNPIMGSKIKLLSPENGNGSKLKTELKNLSNYGEEKERLKNRVHSYDEQHRPLLEHVSSDKEQDGAAGEQGSSHLEHGAPYKEHVPYINLNTNNKTFISPKEEEVTKYFSAQGCRKNEGLKFFHHYQSIGWKKSGVILTNWRAAAKVWILRSSELNDYRVPPVKMRNQDNLKITKAKHYDKPL